jgi:glycosyltransferase involved in cell wall biosynthesis
MVPIRATFVMEQTLGHVTHARNLQDVAAARTDLTPTWLPIPFGVHGPSRFVPLLRGNWSVRASWRARRALGSALAATSQNALLFHTQVTSLFSVDLMRRIPSIVSLDATPINFDSVGRPYHHRAAGNSLIDQHKFRLNRRVFHAATRMVSWSEWARRSLIDDYAVPADRIRVLAPGAAGAYFDLGEARLRRPDDARDGAPVRLLFVGGDFERKGGPLLLDCLRGSLGERCELHLVTQRDVEPRPNVHVYRGLRPNSLELLRLFALADVFVLPSLAECLAVVLMEAGAAGLPVITTDIGALAEAVCPGESGLVVPAGDGRALACAVETLVSDALLRRRMGRASQTLARGKFDARQNNRMLLDLLVEMAQAAESARVAA